MKSKSFLSIDIFLFVSVAVLMVVGIMFIYSSSISFTEAEVLVPWYSSEWFRQVIWVILGISLIFVFTFIDHKSFAEIAVLIYGFFIFLLFLTLIFGQVRNGARSWFGIAEIGVQPSEFAKLALVIFLSKYYSDNHTRIKEFQTFAIGLGISLLPFGLVILQPDLGTSMTFLAIFFAVSFMAGIKGRYLLFLFIVGVVSLIMTVLPHYEIRISGGYSIVSDLITNTESMLIIAGTFLGLTVLSLWGYNLTKQKGLYWAMFVSGILLLSTIGTQAGQFAQDRNILKPYQMDRLIIFLDPYVDEQGAGWNIIQSLNAVGSGGFFGKGYLQGIQSHSNYVPEQSTDFIYSILAEEWGYIGALAIFGLFLVIAIRGFYIMSFSKDRFSVLLVMGIIGMLIFHFIINVGMAIGIMPITGIPLYFLSYGGSSLLAASIGVGIIMNIHTKRYL
jgi:rod shape determining protein RodA